MLWEVDKRQAEWVVMAYLTGDANMIQVVESGQDTHIHTASLMFKASKELIEMEGKAVGSSTDQEFIELMRADLGGDFTRWPRTMSARQCGKKSNHGLNYDEGPNQFGLINEIEQTEAKRIVEMYHTIYPGIRLWYEHIKRQLQNGRVLTNCFGRRVRFMDQWGPDLWKGAYSMLPQSTVVDSLNDGMCKIYGDDDITSTNGANIDILAQVHDSILMQVPIPVALSDGFAKLQQKVYDYVSPQLTYNGRTFTIATDMKVGLNWGTFHKEQNPGGMREVKSVEELQKALENLNVGAEPR